MEWMEEQVASRAVHRFIHQAVVQRVRGEGRCREISLKRCTLKRYTQHSSPPRLQSGSPHLPSRSGRCMLPSRAAYPACVALRLSLKCCRPLGQRQRLAGQNEEEPPPQLQAVQVCARRLQRRPQLPLQHHLCRPGAPSLTRRASFMVPRAISRCPRHSKRKSTPMMTNTPSFKPTMQMH